MSRECTDSEVSNHQVLSPHEENNSNRMLGKTTSRSKVYPLEGFTHSEIRNDQVNEKVMVVEVEGSPNELAAPKQQKSLCRRNLTEAIVVTVTIITTALAFISFARYYLSPYSRSEFIYVNMIWRHGDRAPVYHFPNFTEKYMIAFPRGLGNLTKIGREQAEQLGLLIKDRYIHPYDITSEQIYVRSTDVFRTIETARHVLQGMSFPEIKVNASLKTSVDTAGNPFFDCPVANQFVQDRKEKYLMRENFTEIYELVLQKLNYSNDLYRVFDTLLCL
uniref:acid phosphatase n=1 Tax=Elaeophora elaphi TaxID=1147741 RepID=A0A0R3RJ22_9BILA